MDIQYTIYVVIFFGLIVGFLSWAWWQRSKYNKLTEGMLLCEFWPETGRRYKKLLPVEVNGIEVKAPKGHQCPRYFFNKEATYNAKYPDAPFLNLSFLQVDVSIVSWPEDNPEPINPYRRPGSEVMSAALIDTTRDNDFMAFAMAMSHEIEVLQKQLADALMNGANKQWVYIGLGVVAALAIASTVLGYLNYGILKEGWQ